MTTHVKSKNVNHLATKGFTQKFVEDNGETYLPVVSTIITALLIAKLHQNLRGQFLIYPIKILENLIYFHTFYKLSNKSNFRNAMYSIICYKKLNRLMENI